MCNQYRDYRVNISNNIINIPNFIKILDESKEYSKTIGCNKSIISYIFKFYNDNYLQKSISIVNTNFKKTRGVKEKDEIYYKYVYSYIYSDYQRLRDCSHSLYVSYRIEASKYDKNIFDDMLFSSGYEDLCMKIFDYMNKNIFLNDFIEFTSLYTAPPGYPDEDIRIQLFSNYLTTNYIDDLTLKFDQILSECHNYK